MKFTVRLFAAAVCASLLGAFTASAQERSTKQMSATTASHVDFEVIRTGSNAFGREKPSEALVRSSAEWEEVWKCIESGTIPRPPAPKVDFKARAVVAVFQGEQKTGGYKVEVRSVTRSADGKTLHVEVLEKRPPKGAILTQAFTSPYQVIAVPAGDFALEVKRVHH